MNAGCEAAAAAADEGEERAEDAAERKQATPSNHTTERNQARPSNLNQSAPADADEDEEVAEGGAEEKHKHQTTACTLKHLFQRLHLRLHRARLRLTPLRAKGRPTKMVAASVPAKHAKRERNALPCGS